MRRFFFQEVRAGLRNRPFFTLLIILASGVGLGAVTALQAELSGATKWWEDRFAQPLFEIYLSEEATEDDGLLLRDQLASQPSISQVAYISPAEAQAEVEAYLGSIAFSVLPENPLPASIRMVIAPAHQTSDYANHLSDSLITIPGVSEILAAQEQIQVFEHGRNVIQRATDFLFIGTQIWVGFWLFIGMFMILRRSGSQMNFWHYLGTPPGWFRWPALAAGCVLGVSTVFVGWIATQFFVAAEWARISAFQISMMNIMIQFVGPIVMGILAGWLAYRVTRHGGKFRPRKATSQVGV